MKLMLMLMLWCGVALAQYVPPSGGGGNANFSGTVTTGNTVMPLGWVDVRAKGAKCDGLTDDSATFTAAVAAAPTGGTIFVPTGTCLAHFTISKSLTLRGLGQASVIQGTAVSIVTISSDDVTIQDLTISDPTGNAATVGLNFLNGDFPASQPFGHCFVERVQLTGNTTAKLGVGIKWHNFITGAMSGLVVRGWDKGAVFEAHANAISVFGGHYSLNNVGLDYSAGAAADSASISGATIEINTTAQVIAQAVLTFTLTGNHIELSTGTYGVEAIGGMLLSSGNIYCCGSGHSVGDDLVVSGNSGSVISIGDSFSNGIANNATDGKRVLVINDGLVPITGTGPITKMGSRGYSALNGAALGFSSLGVGPENVVLYSQDFTNGAWTSANAGTGSAAVVAGNASWAPDGTTTASRIQLSRGASDTSADYSMVQQVVSGLPNPHAKVLSVWLKSNTASTYSVAVRDGQSAVYQTVSVTPLWQRFTVPVVADASAVANPQLILRGGYSTSASADILAWGYQINLGTIALPYTATTSAAITNSSVVQAPAFSTTRGAGITSTTCTVWTAGLCTHN